jgi:DNA-binding IclR family transcriptional regulator
MLRILDLIEEAPEGLLSFDALHQALGFTRSTLYRHLKTLGDAGLIAAIPDRGFTLGPRVMELDYRMRQRDPLIVAARPVMAELARSIPGIALLCRLYRDRVLCIHQEQGGASFHSHYSRGLGRPMFQGAASRIILAHLPSTALARLQAAHAEGFAAAGLGSSAAEAREILRPIRQRGWDVTEGQVTPGVTGIAAPVFEGKDQILGSLSVTVGQSRLDTATIGRFAERVVFSARIIGRASS